MYGVFIDIVYPGYPVVLCNHAAFIAEDKY